VRRSARRRYQTKRAANVQPIAEWLKAERVPFNARRKNAVMA